MRRGCALRPRRPVPDVAGQRFGTSAQAVGQWRPRFLGWLDRSTVLREVHQDE